MYTRQTNPAALRSQKLICDAMGQLLRELLFQEITVTRICQEAGVGRKTFYRNFERKEDVVERMIDEMLLQYEAELPELPLEQQAKHHFTFLAERIDLLIALYHAGLSPMVASRFASLRPQLLPCWSEDETEQAYRTAAVAASIEAVVRLWAERGFRESIDELVRLYTFSIGVQQ